MFFLIKHNEQSYKDFPFEMEDLDKFHELMEQKVIPRFEFMLKTKFVNLNVRDACQKDYKLTEKYTLRFTYLGEIFLMENSQKLEISKGNLKKIPDVGKLISDMKTIVFIDDAINSMEKT